MKYDPLDPIISVTFYARSDYNESFWQWQRGNLTGKDHDSFTGQALGIAMFEWDYSLHNYAETSRAYVSAPNNWVACQC